MLHTYLRHTYKILRGWDDTPFLELDTSKAWTSSAPRRGGSLTAVQVRAAGLQAMGTAAVCISPLQALRDAHVAASGMGDRCSPTDSTAHMPRE